MGPVVRAGGWVGTRGTPQAPKCEAILGLLHRGRKLQGVMVMSKGDRFPELDLPIPIPYAPMEARRVELIPDGNGWAFEPKWDGFRALVFRSGADTVVQSKSMQPLTRYFPELVGVMQGIRRSRFVLDGEIVIPVGGRLSFDDLLLRIHPAESRVQTLARQSPAVFIAFDLLCDGAGARGDHTGRTFEERRRKLEKFLERSSDGSSVLLTPSTGERVVAERWFMNLAEEGLDGVIAKRYDLPYRSGERDGMVKVKHFRTADCVVGGYRSVNEGSSATLLLGLYGERGALHYVGHASLPRQESEALRKRVRGLKGDNPFEIGSPGGPSRWSKGEPREWVSLRPELVCEVRFDHFSQGRFRHGTRFLRWRPDKAPGQCDLEQVSPDRDGRLLRTLGL